MPSQICESTTLSNKIVNENIVNFLRFTLKYRWKSKSVVSVRFCVGHPIPLQDAGFQSQAEVLSDLSCKHSRNGIHPRLLKGMYRKKPWFPICR